MVCSDVMQRWRWHPNPFHSTLLYYKVLSFVMVEMAPNPLQENGGGVPSHYIILSYTQLTCAILHHHILYCTILYYSMLCCAIVWHALLWYTRVYLPMVDIVWMVNMKHNPIQEYYIVRWDATSTFLWGIGCHLHHYEIQYLIIQQSGVEGIGMPSPPLHHNRAYHSTATIAISIVYRNVI